METTSKKNLIYFVIVIIFLGCLFLIPHKHTIQDIRSIKIAGQNVKVDLALTGAEQEQGLSGRSALPENTGMLFIFPESGTYYFWMKDMNFAIDMIWLDENMKVVYIKKDARPESYPATFGPAAPTKYVLEVPSGFSDKNNLQVGDTVEFGY